VALDEGMTNMDGLERFLAPAQLPAGTSTDLFAADSDDFTLQAALFKALHGFSKQAKGSNMLYNLQAAAFHLSVMLKGFTTSDKLVSLFSLSETSYLDGCQAVPNIPDSSALYNLCVKPTTL